MSLPIRTILLALFLTLCGSGTLSAQSLKVYFENRDFSNPLRHTLNDMVVVPGTREVAFAGEFKSNLPSLDGRGYVMHTTPEGRTRLQYTIGTNFQNSTNGARVSGLAMDKIGNYYLAGGYSGNLNQYAVGGERTLTSLSPKGKFQWSAMQGYYHFESVAYDDWSETLLTLSGPESSNVPTNLTIQQFSDHGDLLAGVRVMSGANDQPIQLLDLPGQEGYLALGMYDTADVRQPMLVRLTQDLTISWSKVYMTSLPDLDITDLAFVSSEKIGISGTAFSKQPGAARPVLIMVDAAEGTPIWCHTYQFGNAYEAYGTSLVGFSDWKTQQGGNWILAGGYASGPLHLHPERRSFALRIDDLGEVVWGWDYSDLSVSDYTHDEIATAAVSIPSVEQFVIGGEFTRYQQDEVVRRMLWMVRANVSDGSIDGEGSSCSEAIKAQAKPHAFSDVNIGEATYEGSSQSFGYLEGELKATIYYCSYPHQEKLATALDASLSDLGTQQSWQSGTAYVYDLNGRLIQQKNLEAGNGTIEFQPAGLSQGIYLLRIQLDDRWLPARKILHQ